jgi:chromosome segregation ATPase
MARPPEFSDDLIISAGKQIQAENGKVSPFALKERVGGGRASRLMDVWQKYLQAQVDQRPLVMTPLPTEVTRELDVAMKSLAEQVRVSVTALYQRALDSFEQRIRTMEAEIVSRQEQVVGDQDEADQIIDDLKLKVENANRRIFELMADVAEADKSLQAQAKSHVSMKEQLIAAQNERAVSEVEVRASKQQADILQAERDQSRKFEIEAREKLARLAGEVDVLSKTNERLLARRSESAGSA